MLTFPPSGFQEQASGGPGLKPARRDLVGAIRDAALAAVDPAEAVRRWVQREQDVLRIAARDYSLASFEHVWIAGGGKAAGPMAAALAERVGEQLSGGVIVTKYGHADAGPPAATIAVYEAGHPVPDEAGVRGARQLADVVRGAGPADLILCPISGGGSALMVLPVPGVTLSDLQMLTEQLLRSGATINELNAVRKHLSQIKGGGLARMATPATLVSLILSDVVGDPLDVIASGPTVPDPTTFQDAWAVLERYELIESAPPSIVGRLKAGNEAARETRGGKAPAETPKPGDPIFERVQNVIVGSNRTAAQGALEKARELGFNPLLLTTYVEGEAREVAHVVAALAKEIVRYDEPVARPACLICGGETTVTVRGDGLGGRNQELALAAAPALEGWPDIVLLALATDGTDGPTDAAGAFVSGDTVARARQADLDPLSYLARNDSYHFFEKLGDLVVTGPTQTNVNDLLFIFVF
jgi:glycerate 2-kinase